MDYDTASIPEIAGEYERLATLESIEQQKHRKRDSFLMSRTAEEIWLTRQANTAFAALCKAVEEEGKRR